MLSNRCGLFVMFFTVMIRSELVPKLLECLGHQIFRQDLVGVSSVQPLEEKEESHGHLDSNSSSDLMLLRARRHLSDQSANAFRALCVSAQDLLIIQGLISNLVAGN